jgi:DNA-3-methyladenine glycosylase II
MFGKFLVKCFGMNKADIFLSKDKHLAPLVKKFGPLEHLPRKKSQYFVSLVRAIAGQQLSIKAAATIYKRVEEKAGKVTPGNILAIKDEDLRACGLSWAKIKYVKDLAERTQDGRLKINKLDKLPEEEVMRELVAVKGIGPWTAEMFLMFTLGAPDIFPVDDLGIKNGLKKLTGREMSKEQMARFAMRWKPYRTQSAMYIWELLDNK